MPVTWQVQIWEERKQKVVAELRCRNEVKGVCLHRAARLKNHTNISTHIQIHSEIGWSLCSVFFLPFLAQCRGHHCDGM